MKFAVVFPCYNEAATLPLLVEQTILAAQKNGFSSEEFQIVLVNNGSTDESFAVLQELARGPSAEWLGVVHVPFNQGYGHGIMVGLKFSRADFLGWSHADLQCNPQDIFTAYQKLISRMAEDKACSFLIKGARKGRRRSEVIFSLFFALLSRIILGVSATEINAQPKIFNRSFLSTLVSPPKDFSFDLYALYCAQKSGTIVDSIDVDFPPRMHGHSRWSFSFMSRLKTIYRVICYMIFLRKAEGRCPSA